MKKDFISLWDKANSGKFYRCQQSILDKAFLLTLKVKDKTLLIS